MHSLDGIPCRPRLLLRVQDDHVYSTCSYETFASLPRREQPWHSEEEETRKMTKRVPHRTHPLKGNTRTPIDTPTVLCRGKFQMLTRSLILNYIQAYDSSELANYRQCWITALINLTSLER